MTAKPIGIGIIGCGNISGAYFKGAARFENIKVVSCADLSMNAAQAKAEEFDSTAESVDDLLANPEVDIVINLTIPAVHAEVSMKALEAGKHVHSEKPLSVSFEDAQELLATAEKKGLLVGCAPDTFLGGGFQTCRKLIDDGWIGRPVAGTAFMMSRGPESWHPNPSFFYEVGGGPMFDMGPYYLTALIHLLGPIKRISAVTSKAFEVRTATCEEQFGKQLPVEIPTHSSGSLEFHNGAVISMTISFDVYANHHNPIEIYGTEGSLGCPDPNTFGGPVSLWTPTAGEWQDQAFSHRYIENFRSIGVADMARVLQGEDDTPLRTNGLLAAHALEAMHAFEKSSTTGKHVDLTTKPEQPAALPLGLIEGRVTV